jgi:hypothetical protein
MRVTLSAREQIAANLGAFFRWTVAFPFVVPVASGEFGASFGTMCSADAALRSVQLENDWPQPTLIFAKKI